MIQCTISTLDETRRCVLSRAARQALIHGSATEHKKLNTRPHSLPVEHGKCPPTNFTRTKNSRRWCFTIVFRSDLPFRAQRCFANWLSILKLPLPSLSHFSGVAHVLYLITFSVWYSTRRGVRCLDSKHRSPSLPSWHVRWRSALVAPCGEHTFSWNSEAFLFKWYVLSKRITSWVVY